MPDQIRLWEISKDQLNEITQSKLDLESRLETWLDFVTKLNEMRSALK